MNNIVLIALVLYGLLGLCTFPLWLAGLRVGFSLATNQKFKHFDRGLALFCSVVWPLALFGFSLALAISGRVQLDRWTSK